MIHVPRPLRMVNGKIWYEPSVPHDVRFNFRAGRWLAEFVDKGGTTLAEIVLEPDGQMTPFCFDGVEHVTTEG